MIIGNMAVPHRSPWANVEHDVSEQAGTGGRVLLRQGEMSVLYLRAVLERMPDDLVFARTFHPTPDPNRAVELLFTSADDANNW